MSKEDRQTLAASLRREPLLSSLSRADFQRGARDSIFAPPEDSLSYKHAEQRIPYLRSTSQDTTLRTTGRNPRRAAERYPQALSKSTVGQAAVMARPFPQRGSSLAPIPVIEPETDHVLVVQNKLPTPPDELTMSPMDAPLPTVNRPVGLPFLQPVDQTPPTMTAPTMTAPRDPARQRQLPVPQFLASPLSDSPMPTLPNLTPPPRQAPTIEDPFDAPPQASDMQRARLALAGGEASLGRFSPYSEPDYEATGSYFTPRYSGPRADTPKPNVPSRPPSRTISHPLQHRLDATEQPQASQHVPAPAPRRVQFAPLKAPTRPDVKRGISTPFAPQLPPPPRDIAPARPHLIRATTEMVPPRGQHLAVPPPIPNDPRSASRNFVLSMASPVDDPNEVLPAPSAWNDYLGFCEGAALAQMGRSDAMIQSRNVQADSHTTVNFLKCSSNKCAFQGHGPADKVYEVSGVYFRRDFLVKSHCKQKKARHAIYAFQCSFCVLTRQKAAPIQGTDAFMAHVATHRTQHFSPAVLERVRCITGRKAQASEPFDVNFLPVQLPTPAPTPTPTPPVANTTNPFELFNALHSNPVAR